MKRHDGPELKNGSPAEPAHLPWETKLNDCRPSWRAWIQPLWSYKASRYMVI